MSTHAHKILILDFGSQYSQLIARRVRECFVYCEMHTYHMSDEAIRAFNPTAVILSGGPESVTASNSPRAPHAVFELGVPVLGICYGMQTMAVQLGGAVAAGEKREFGYAEVEVVSDDALFQGIEDRVNAAGASLLDTWMSHGDHVTVLPPSFKATGRTESCDIVAMADASRHYYGLQFHPEVMHTPQGMRLIKRFVNQISGCSEAFTPKNIIEDQIQSIREKVGQDQVLLGLSGGVDSSVAALLLHQAIGSQLICVFVDTGFLRLNEVEQVQGLFQKHFGIKLITVNASDLFYEALKGIEDPEAKRKVAGKCFIDVFEAEAAKLHAVKWLAQGTIYSDVIESAATNTGQAHVIKSHHNVGGLPAHMRLSLLEPLRELFKDEVRQVGLALGLPHELVYRHPFPGPGLVIRVMGEVQAEYVKKLQLADAIFMEELHKANLYHQVSQAFAVFLPVKSVGVIGDARQYEPVIALRCVESHDFMTAHWSRLPYELLEVVSNRIINEVRGISRVVYDISGKPPATIEWE